MKAKKRYGQNFLIDDYYINSIINSINVFLDDLIIEIGPGKGALTKRLKEKKANLIAYEVDQDLKSILTKLEDEKTKVIFKDFLQTDLSNLKNKYQNIYVIGNLPYYITTPIIEHIIKTNLNPKEMIIMVQKEVADRFLAKPHSKEYGYFTVYLQYFFDIKRIINVPSKAFNPAPKIESTVLKLKKREEKPEIDIEKYSKFLKQCFKQKRKKLKNNLENYDYEKLKEILQKHGFDINARAEELNEETLIDLCQNLL